MPEPLKWFPISADYTAGGALTSLAGFPNADQLKPLPLPLLRRNFNQYYDGYDETSVQVAALLGLAGFGALETHISSKEYTFNFVRYEECLVEETGQPPIEGLIHGTRWGAGMRVRARVITSSSQLSEVSLPSIGISVELGTMSVSFEAEIIGIADPALIAALPGPGRLDNRAVEALLQVASRIEHATPADLAQWTPLPYRVYLPESCFVDHIYEALSISFAAYQIRNGRSYAAAVARVRPPASWLAVYQLYQRLGIPTNDQPVPPDKRHLADDYI